MSEPSIIRIKKHKTEFTVMANRAIQDENLSFKATGLLCYLMSLPDDWVIRSSDLSSRKREKEWAIRSAFQELSSAGYVVRKKVQNPDGRGWITLTYVYERPQKISK